MRHSRVLAVLMEVGILSFALQTAFAAPCTDPKWQAMAAQCCEAVDLGAVSQVCSNACSNACTCPSCPNLEPTCAKWVRRYDRQGRLRTEKCKRWATVSAQPVQ